MFMTLFVVLLVLWLLGFFAFHVAGGLIHLLLIIAVISLIMHFFRAAPRFEARFLTTPLSPRRAVPDLARNNRTNSATNEIPCGFGPACVLVLLPSPQTGSSDGPRIAARYSEARHLGGESQKQWTTKPPHLINPVSLTSRLRRRHRPFQVRAWPA